MRTLLICHDDAALDREGLARWLGSFSTFVGTVAIREPGGRLRKRIAREVRRVGWWRFLDVIAFRLFHRLTRAAADRAWEDNELGRLRARHPERPDAPDIVVSSPNSSAAQAFIAARKPDLVIARCKTLLNERIFTIPELGTFVMHPGVCPEYRNAHGCFWAMASGDFGNVGMTLLRIDRGVDTGPVFGYFRVDPDLAESHVVTQHRVVLENLDAIRDTLLAVEAGTATPIDTTGRRSATWGQPWLTAFLAMRLGARRAGAHQSEIRNPKSEIRGRPVVNVLMYHDVVAAGEEDTSGFPGRDAALYKVTPQTFAAHLEALASAVPDPVITFDDGGKSGMMAAEMLEQRGWRGHFFVTTNYIGTRGFLTGDDIRQLARRGHVIGSHSCSHPLRIGHCSWTQLLDEWSRSRAVLSEAVGDEVRTASVPGGDFAPQVAEAAARAGITTLFTSEPTAGVRYAFGLTLVGRFAIQRWTTSDAAAALASGDWLPCARQAVVWNAKKMTKRLGGERYLQIRKLLLRHGDEVQWGDNNRQG